MHLFRYAVLALFGVTGCLNSEDPKEIPSSDAGPGDAPADTPIASTCPTPTGAGTTHNGAKNIDADETWTAAGSPHLVTFDQHVVSGATLTIEPCAVVRVVGARGLTFDTGAKLVAEGTPDKPIRFEQLETGKPWGYLRAFGPSTIRLAYATIDGAGGEPVNAYGALEVRADQAKPAVELLHVDHVTIKGSAGFGVSLREGGAFTKTSTDLTITGSTLAPLRIQPRLATNIPKGTYTGNTEDVIQVETSSYGEINLEDVTFRARGIPYKIGSKLTFGDLRIGGGSVATTLTIEPGVVLKFNKHTSAALLVEPGTGTKPATGSLVAVGTAEQPIVFTSADPAPTAGAWRGLVFGQIPTASNKLEHVKIEFAGGPSGANSFHCMPDGSLSRDEDAAISIFGQPASAFVKNSTIADSAGVGINLAYYGTFVDFAPTNTFTSIAKCKVSYPRDDKGACPATVACP